jgi:protein TonB
MALSFALHGAVLVPLLLTGTSGNATRSEPAFMVEILRAAPAPTGTPEPAVDLPAVDEAPPVDSAEVVPPNPELPTPADAPPPVDVSEVGPMKVDLPPPDEPPPLKSADVKPVEPPKPKPQPPHPPQVRPQPTAPPKPASAHAPSTAAVTQTVSSPDTGIDQVTQTAAAAPAIVFSQSPRFRVPPKPAPYPPRAQELGQQGEVRVRVRLNPDGSIAEIVLHRSSGYELLDKSALASVPGWQFAPEMRNGRAVAAWVEFPVRFHLR